MPSAASSTKSAAPVAAVSRALPWTPPAASEIGIATVDHTVDHVHLRGGLADAARRITTHGRAEAPGRSFFRKFLPHARFVPKHRRSENAEQ